MTTSAQQLEQLRAVYRLDLNADELMLFRAYVEASALIHCAITQAHCDKCSVAMGQIAGNVMRKANDQFIERNGSTALAHLDDRLRLLIGGGA